MLYCQGLQSVWLSNRVCAINYVMWGCWILSFRPLGLSWTGSADLAPATTITAVCSQASCSFCFVIVAALSSGAQVFRAGMSSPWISPISIRKCPSIVHFMPLFRILHSFVYISLMPLNEYTSFYFELCRTTWSPVSLGCSLGLALHCGIIWNSFQ